MSPYRSTLLLLTVFVSEQHFPISTALTEGRKTRRYIGLVRVGRSSDIDLRRPARPEY
jgi:hypothetical protein